MTVAERPTNGRADLTIKLPAPEFTTFRLKLVGTSPLILDRFTERAKEKIARSQDGTAKQKDPPRDPEAEYLEACYRTTNGQYGVPKLAFRKAIQSGATRGTDVKGTVTLAAFQIDTPDEILPLETVDPRMRTDHALKGHLRYRPEFWPWAVVLPIKLDHEIVSLEQFAHIVYKAGLGVGIGNWRAEKKGDFGLWTIESISDVRIVGMLP